MSGNAHAYAGKVFLAPSGQWGFKFYENDVEIGGVAGMESEAKAVEECDAVCWVFRCNLCLYEPQLCPKRQRQPLGATGEPALKIR